MVHKRFNLFLLVVLLAAPALFYLFLQVFGENEFHLQPIGQLEHDCSNGVKGIILGGNMDSTIDLQITNQLNRLKQYDFVNDLIVKNPLNGCFDSLFVYFVDGTTLMGKYKYNLEDVDRLINEVELYNKIQRDYDYSSTK